MSDRELLRQRDFLDELIASRLSAHEHKKSMQLIDSIYFNDKLPKNVIQFPLNRIRRLNVNKSAKQPRKKNI
tara:strand:- start:732 stop:947 length:216 start_codon:yes stop_codon:yes gene_type:complete